MVHYVVTLFQREACQLHASFAAETHLGSFLALPPTSNTFGYCPDLETPFLLCSGENLELSVEDDMKVPVIHKFLSPLLSVDGTSRFWTSSSQHLTFCRLLL